MQKITAIPTVTVPLNLKVKWEELMSATRARTAKLTIYGRRHILRDDVEEAVFQHVQKSEVESLYTTTSPKNYFITFKQVSVYEEFLTKTVNISGAQVKPLPFDCLDIEARLHWLQEEVPDEMIAFFLEEFCDDVSTIKHEVDENGIKSGVRIATIRLLNHQRNDFPHILMLQPQRPMLITIPGRAPLCLRCHHLGHVRAACNTPYCRHCQIYGHTTESCKPSYANATKGKQPPPPPPTHTSQEKDSSDHSTDSDDNMFKTDEEALARDTQEWNTVRRKKKKKNPSTTPNPTPPHSSKSPTPTVPLQSNTVKKSVPPTRSSMSFSSSPSDSEESMEEDVEPSGTANESTPHQRPSPSATDSTPTTATPDLEKATPAAPPVVRSVKRKSKR